VSKWCALIPTNLHSLRLKSGGEGVEIQLINLEEKRFWVNWSGFEQEQVAGTCKHDNEMYGWEMLACEEGFPCSRLLILAKKAEHVVLQLSLVSPHIIAPKIELTSILLTMMDFNRRL
jgi:hypothetical protein